MDPIMDQDGREPAGSVSPGTDVTPVPPPSGATHPPGHLHGNSGWAVEQPSPGTLGRLWSRRPGLLVAGVVCAVLALVAGGASAWHLLGPRSAPLPLTTATVPASHAPDPDHTISLATPSPPSDAWAEGAQRLWETPSGTIKGHCYLVTSQLLCYSDGVLTAFSPDDSHVEKGWSISVDLETADTNPPVMA